jgi:hypothetical protein
MTEHEIHNLQSWKQERKNIYFCEVHNFVKEDNGNFKENEKIIKYLVVKMISINSDYNRKTHEIENKFKDH